MAINGISGCIGCGTCFYTCPTNVILLNSKGKAEMKLKASLMKTESRCRHYRLDYSDMDNENWQA